MMNPTEVLEELPISDWHGPFAPALRQRAYRRWKTAGCCCCLTCRSESDRTKPSS